MTTHHILVTTADAATARSGPVRSRMWLAALRRSDFHINPLAPTQYRTAGSAVQSPANDRLSYTYHYATNKLTNNLQNLVFNYPATVGTRTLYKKRYGSFVAGHSKQATPLVSTSMSILNLYSALS